jgi:hypothetical protein
MLSIMAFIRPAERPPLAAAASANGDAEPPPSTPVSGGGV